MKRFLKIALALVALAVILGAMGFVGWGLTPQAAMPQALAALQSDSQVQVQTSPWYIFRPTGSEPVTGLIFYPGGHVDPRAYAPMAHAIAAQGYLVVIPPMPLALAFFGIGVGQDVMNAYPQIRSWAVAGHSLGGVAAASFAASRPDRVQALALWASYPADGDSLATSTLKVVSIYATQDGLSTGAKIDTSRKLLPASTQWVEIMGGNHGQFGWYGAQSGDGTATISREDQQKQIVDATVALLKEISQ
ncbi:MAG: alpha/beta hydrolase [Anaerolineae bacterium]